MPYVEQNLLKGEKVMYCGEVHWAIFLPCILLLSLGILLPGIILLSQGVLSDGGVVLLPLCAIGLGIVIFIYLRKRTTEFAVTNQRVIIAVGVLSRKTIEMNLTKVENIQVDQSVLGRVLGYGTVTIVGTGGTHEPFSYIANPLVFRKAVARAGRRDDEMNGIKR